MSEISEKIDEIIKTGIAPLLKGHGFKKKARNFYRSFDDRIDVINVQASQSNLGAKGKSTINLGVYYPAVAEIIEAIPVKGMPKEYNCTVRERIGGVLDDRQDIWWSVDETTNLKEVAIELATKVEVFCLPWLEEVSTVDKVKSKYSKVSPFTAAGISLMQGNKVDAKNFLEASIKKKPRAKSRSIGWAKRHGLIYP